MKKNHKDVNSSTLFTEHIVNINMRGVIRVAAALVMCLVMVITLTACEDKTNPSTTKPAETKIKIGEKLLTDDSGENEGEESTDEKNVKEDVEEEKDDKGNDKGKDKGEKNSTSVSQPKSNTSSSSTDSTPKTDSTTKSEPKTTATTAHVHKYSIFVKTVAPTTTERGYDVYQCSCGATTKANYKDVIKNTNYVTETDVQNLVAELKSYAVSKRFELSSTELEGNSGCSPFLFEDDSKDILPHIKQRCKDQIDDYWSICGFPQGGSGKICIRYYKRVIEGTICWQLDLSYYPT